MQRLTAPLLTVAQAAEQLHVSAYSVYALCKADELAHVRIGNSIRIDADDLQTFLGAQKGNNKYEEI